MINKKKLRKIETKHGTFYWKAKGKYAEDVYIYAESAGTFDGPDAFTHDGGRIQHRRVDNGRGVHVSRVLTFTDELDGLHVTPKFVEHWLNEYFEG